ncbi:MAG: RidA family protein [Pseudomonadota bacterium]
MNTSINTDKAPPSFSNYSQAVEVPAGARRLHVSGQVGVDLSGKLPSDFAAQHRLAWENVCAILDAAGMDKTDLVEVLAIVSDHEQVPIYRTIRDEMLGGHECASTMLVCGLASPDWKVEIAVVAAKVD